ncbi:hypothetical protein D3C86_1992770 [compost metagenome]
MPSSMRLTTIDNGAWVASARYAMVAVPKANAMGIPPKTQAPSSTRKKIIRL